MESLVLDFSKVIHPRLESVLLGRWLLLRDWCTILRLANEVKIKKLMSRRFLLHNFERIRRSAAGTTVLGVWSLPHLIKSCFLRLSADRPVSDRDQFSAALRRQPRLRFSDPRPRMSPRLGRWPAVVPAHHRSQVRILSSKSFKAELMNALIASNLVRLGFIFVQLFNISSDLKQPVKPYC